MTNPRWDVEKVGERLVCGKGHLLKRENINVLHLEGTPYEMGYQHGALLKDQIRQGSFKFFLELLDRLLAKSTLARLPQFVSDISKNYLRNRIINRIVAHMPGECKEELEGIAAGAALELSDIEEAFVMADLTSYLGGKFFKKMTLQDLPGGALMEKDGKGGDRKKRAAKPPNGVFGCTSMIAYGKATVDQTLVHARNMDFIGIHFWDRFPTVIYYHPHDALRFVTVASAGFPFGGLTSMNERGLCLGLHQNYTNDITVEHAPILTLGHLVINKAQTLDEALAIIRANPPNAGWTVGISDWKVPAPNPKGLAIELSANRMEIRESTDDFMAIANSYTTEPMQSTEIVINEAITNNSHSRYRRMVELVREHYGRVDAWRAAEFLGDHFDPNLGRERSIGDIVTQLLNLQAVVFIPEKGMFYVANGRAPVSNSDFVPFLLDESNPPLPSSQPEPHSPSSNAQEPYGYRILPGNPFRNSPKFRALKHITGALVHYRAEDYNKVLSELEWALVHDPDEPIIHHLTGMIHLINGTYEKARTHFDRALKQQQIPYKLAVNHLWLGRTYDLMGERKSAVQEYRRAQEIAPNSRSIRKVVKSALRKPYRDKLLQFLDLEFWLGEEMELS